MEMMESRGRSYPLRFRFFALFTGFGTWMIPRQSRFQGGAWQDRQRNGVPEDR